MNCESVNPEIIYRGEDKSLLFKFKTVTGEPYDLTGSTEITARFKNEDDTVLEKTLTGGGVVVVSLEGGTARVQLSDLETLVLKTGERQSVTVYLDVIADRRIVDFVKSISVMDPSV